MPTNQLGRRALKKMIVMIISALATVKYNFKMAKTKRLAERNKDQKAEIVLWNDIWSVVNIPWALQHDFAKYRAITYIPKVEEAYDRYYSFLLNLDTKSETLSIPDDKQFLLILYHTPMALYIKKTNSRTHTVDISDLIYLRNFAGYYDIRKIDIDTETNKLTFFTKNNEKINSEHPLYHVAKIHATVCLTYFSPGIGHSWVHFDFPCVVSAICYNMLPNGSVLHKILTTHTRFTLAINNQALRVQQATNNHNNWKGKLDPIKPFPVTADTFVFSNSRRVLDFYKKCGEFHCPPTFNEDIPYCKILMLYYHEIRKFIESIKEDIEKNLLADFITELNKYFPVVNEFDPYDVLATFIWQACIAHPTDHFTYYQAMKSCGSTVAIKRVLDCSPESTINDIIDPMYLAKFKNFLEIFVQFNYFPEFNNSMANLTYDFSNPKLLEKEKAFTSNLHALETKLIQEGALLCPLSRMAQSICF